MQLNHTQYRGNMSEGYYFELTAKNGQALATSNFYTTKDACENGIRSVRHNETEARIIDE